MAYRHPNFPCRLSREERISQVCSKCVEFISEEEADENDIEHCVVDGYGLTSSHLEDTGECNKFFER